MSKKSVEGGAVVAGDRWHRVRGVVGGASPILLCRGVEEDGEKTVSGGHCSLRADLKRRDPDPGETWVSTRQLLGLDNLTPIVRKVAARSEGEGGAAEHGVSSGGSLESAGCSGYRRAVADLL